MTYEEGNNTMAERQSRFEWRPEDIVILTPDEAAIAEAEYQELLAEMAVEDAHHDQTILDD